MPKKHSACYCVDAVNTNRLEKFLNDTTKVYANAKMHQTEIRGIPRLCLFALSDLPKEIEIKYDYQAPGIWCLLFSHLQNEKVVSIIV